MHAHTTIQFLVQRAEALAQRRQRQDRKPDWLSGFIEETADLFEPQTEAARVGYDCSFDEQAWRVHFYLGDAEHFGGMHDGKRQRIPFDFNLKQLLECFESVDSIRNRTLSSESVEGEEQTTLIEITGLLSAAYGGEQLTVGIRSRPPRAAGPGVRIHPDGSIEAV